MEGAALDFRQVSFEADAFWFGFTRRKRSGCRYSSVLFRYKVKGLPAEGILLLELISALREKESLEQLKKLHASGYDTAELLSYCMEGVRRVGLSFEKGEYFISALIMAGEIMRQAAEYLSSSLLPVKNTEIVGHVLLGTVKGDIHDLGKNILKDMLRCNGFRVTDLGVDVPVQTFVDKTLELEPDFVAVSCLLTNCLDNLAETVKRVREADTGKENLIVVGGNCLDQLVNDAIKADTWFSDAVEAVNFFLEQSGHTAAPGQSES